MLHVLFTALLLVAGITAYSEGIVSPEVMAIGLFFSAYGLCMVFLFRN